MRLCSLKKFDTIRQRHLPGNMGYCLGISWIHPITICIHGHVTCSQIEEGRNGYNEHGGFSVQLHPGEVLDGGEREGAHIIFLQ